MLFCYAVAFFFGNTFTSIEMPVWCGLKCSRAVSHVLSTISPITSWSLTLISILIFFRCWLKKHCCCDFLPSLENYRPTKTQRTKIKYRKKHTQKQKQSQREFEMRMPNSMAHKEPYTEIMASMIILMQRMNFEKEKTNPPHQNNNEM